MSNININTKKISINTKFFHLEQYVGNTYVGTIDLMDNEYINMYIQCKNYNIIEDNLTTVIKVYY